MNQVVMDGASRRRWVAGRSCASADTVPNLRPTLIDWSAVAPRRRYRSPPLSPLATPVRIDFHRRRGSIRWPIDRLSRQRDPIAVH